MPRIRIRFFSHLRLHRPRTSTPLLGPYRHFLQAIHSQGDRRSALALFALVPAGPRASAGLEFGPAFLPAPLVSRKRHKVQGKYDCCRDDGWTCSVLLLRSTTSTSFLRVIWNAAQASLAQDWHRVKKVGRGPKCACMRSARAERQKKERNKERRNNICIQ